MLAVYVNCVAVLFGSIIGVLCSKIVSEKVSEVIKNGAGCVVLVLGIQMSFSPINVVYLALSIIAGGLVGYAINIEEAILKVGDKLKRFVPKKNNNAGKVGEAFLNASVLFCVGAMSIVGSFNAGINQDYSVIFTKSVLDFFLAIVFGATLGIGTAFSAISILIYQGILTLAAGFLKPYFHENMLNAFSCVGGVLLVMIALGLLNLKNLKTANYLPALVFVAIFIALEPLFFV